MQDKIVLTIETCINCNSHSWNTRHVEAKYNQYFAASIFLDWKQRYSG